MKRAGYGLLVFLSILYMPWVVTSGLILAGVFFFNKYFEAVIWIIIIEVLYGPEAVSLIEHRYAFVMLLLLVAAFTLKRFIRFYD
jgi:hypothetical protein